VQTHIELGTTQVLTDNPESAEMQAQVEQEVIQAVAQIRGLSLPHNLRCGATLRMPINLSFVGCAVPQTPHGRSPPPGFSSGTGAQRRLPDVANVLVHLEPPDQV